MLQLDTDDNYALDLNQTEFLQAGTDEDVAGSGQGTSPSGIAAMAYEPRQQVLAAATVAGRVCLFRRWSSSPPAEQAALAADDPAKQWEAQQSFQVNMAWRSAASLMFSHHVCHHAAHAMLVCLPASHWCCEPKPLMYCYPSLLSGGYGALQVGRQPTSLCWGPLAQLLAANCADGLHLCTKALLHHKICEGYAVIQVRTSQLPQACSSSASSIQVLS